MAQSHRSLRHAIRFFKIKPSPSAFPTPFLFLPSSVYSGWAAGVCVLIKYFKVQFHALFSNFTPDATSTTVSSHKFIPFFCVLDYDLLGGLI
jgi:hypothetical protein